MWLRLGRVSSLLSHPGLSEVSGARAGCGLACGPASRHVERHAGRHASRRRASRIGAAHERREWGAHERGASGARAASARQHHLISHVTGMGLGMGLSPHGLQRSKAWKVLRERSQGRIRRRAARRSMTRTASTAAPSESHLKAFCTTGPAPRNIPGVHQAIRHPSQIRAAGCPRTPSDDIDPIGMNTPTERTLAHEAPPHVGPNRGIDAIRLDDSQHGKVDLVSEPTEHFSHNLLVQCAATHIAYTGTP